MSDNSNNLTELCRQMDEAKTNEQLAVEHRRKLEDEFISLVGVAENFEGTETVTPDGYIVKITGRMNRTVDGDKLQELAAEHGLTDHLSSLFRWKPSLVLAAWKHADESITRPLSSAITSKPGRLSIKVEKQENDHE